MKKILSLTVICVLVLGLYACGSSEPSLVGTTPANSSDSTQTTAATEEKVFKPGDTVKLEDVVVTLVDVTKSTGSTYNKPADGNIYVLCEFEITNNSDEELNISSLLNFEAYCDDYSCDYSFGALLEKGDKGQLDGTVAAGKKMKGVIGYELSADWKELEVQFTPDILSDDKIVFVATNS